MGRDLSGASKLIIASTVRLIETIADSCRSSFRTIRGPKTEVADWYRGTILEAPWGFPPERFRSQDFWDALEQILPAGLDPLSCPEDPWDEAQLRLLGLWKEKQMVSRRLLSYDTTNFYTYIASHNTRTELAQRGHNKQGRHNLRQIGLSYVLDGEHGLSLCQQSIAATSPIGVLHLFGPHVGDRRVAQVPLA
jgi:hypothetical protein